MIKSKTTKTTKLAPTVVNRKKGERPPVVAPLTKTATDSTTRQQRDRVRHARTLKGADLKEFVASHRDDLKAVAAATSRRVVSVEAQKLLGTTPKSGKGN